MAENLKEECGTHESTSCGIYNDTGNILRLLSSKIWNGKHDPPFPLQLPVRERVTFSHVKDSTGSVAAVVYRGKNGNETVESDHLMAWSNPKPDIGPNSVWAETREMDHYTDKELQIIHGKLAMTRSSYSDPWNGCVSNITTSNGISAQVEASFSHSL